MDFQLSPEQQEAQALARALARGDSRGPDGLVGSGTKLDTLGKAVVLEELARGSLQLAESVQRDWGVPGESSDGVEHVLLAAILLGRGKACFEEALPASRSRATNDGPDSQMVSTRLADMATKLDSCRALIWRAAWTTDNPEVSEPWLSPLARLHTTESVMGVAVTALELTARSPEGSSRVRGCLGEIGSFMEGDDGLMLRAGVGEMIDQMKV